MVAKKDIIIAEKYIHPILCVGSVDLLYSSFPPYKTTNNIATLSITFV